MIFSNTFSHAKARLFPNPCATNVYASSEGLLTKGTPDGASAVKALELSKPTGSKLPPQGIFVAVLVGWK